MEIKLPCILDGYKRKKDRYCELNFKGCMGTFGVAPAHKYPREWYRSKPELLSDYHQWIIGCQYCHQILDDRSKTTEEEKDEIFNQLRP